MNNYFMKKYLLLLLFIPLMSFGQDFRKMSFGQSIEELKETNPNIEFTVENEMGAVILSHEDYVGGIETTIAYIFLENKFNSGFYFFDDTSYKSATDRYKDFKKVSSLLNDKYEMKENNTWHNDSYKDDPNSYDHALSMGYVDFGEKYSTDKITINHSVSKSEGKITHLVGYISPSMFEFANAKNESDF